MKTSLFRPLVALAALGSILLCIHTASADSPISGGLRASSEKSHLYKFLNALRDDEELDNSKPPIAHSSSALGEGLNKMLNWPLNYLFSGSTETAPATASTSSYSTVPQYPQNNSNASQNNRRLNSSGPGMPESYFRPPIVVAAGAPPPPVHDDIHSMVVHVTYEDICKCIICVASFNALKEFELLKLSYFQLV